MISSVGTDRRARVVVVEDETDIAGLIRRTLERGGDMDVEVVGSGDAALSLVAERAPDLIILDLAYRSSAASKYAASSANGRARPGRRSSC